MVRHEATSRCAVFVPAHNEAQAIGPILETIKKRLSSKLVALVVVDDGSSDKTSDVAAKFTTHVLRIGAPGQPKGNGEATQAGLTYLRDQFAGRLDTVIRIDGDGQHRADWIGDLVTCIEQGADAVVMSRFHGQSDASQAPLDRVLLNTTAARWVADLLGLSVTDARSGYFAYRWSVIEPIIKDLRSQGYGIPAELLVRVWHHAGQQRDPLRHLELPHPAVYAGPQLQEKLQHKWDDESISQQAERLATFVRVMLHTRQSLPDFDEVRRYVVDEYRRLRSSAPLAPVARHIVPPDEPISEPELDTHTLTGLSDDRSVETGADAK